MERAELGEAQRAGGEAQREENREIGQEKRVRSADGERGMDMSEADREGSGMKKAKKTSKVEGEEIQNRKTFHLIPFHPTALLPPPTAAATSALRLLS